MTYFLDTNICAFILNAKFPHLNRRFLACDKNTIKMSSVVLYELYYGAEKSQMREQNLAKIKTFISEIEIVPFDTRATIFAALIRANLERAGLPIGANDTLIAATVLANEGVLVTNNTREFERVKGLVIEDWTHE